LEYSLCCDEHSDSLKTWRSICYHNASGKTRLIFIIFALLYKQEKHFTHTWKTCSPHLSNVRALPCENETAEMLLQLCDVRGLPLPVGYIQGSSKHWPVSCNFLSKTSVPLCFQFLLGNSWISRRAAYKPFDSHQFLIKILSLFIILKHLGLPVINLSLPNSDLSNVIFTPRVK